MKSKTKTWVAVGLMGWLMLMLLGGYRTYKGIVFNIECSGHIKRAGDANSPELARPELDKAITYLENNNMVEGYTSILYRTPDEDLGFLYQNLAISRAELDRVIDNDSSTQLEESNVLMKLRETLLDHGKEGLSVTAPSGISVYPNNGILAFIGWASFLIMCFGVAAATFAADGFEERGKVGAISMGVFFISIVLFLAMAMLGL
jgi:hypothetical protein